MFTVNCPHCQHAMEEDGSLAGRQVLCPECRGQFAMPHFSAAVEDDFSPHISSKARAKASRKDRTGNRSVGGKNRHWTKTAMLIATGVWPVAVVVLGILFVAGGSPRMTEVGNGYFRAENGAVHSAGEVGALYTFLFSSGAGLATTCYGLAMFILLVIWFATKDD
jgi:hypothetical protein